VNWLHINELNMTNTFEPSNTVNKSEIAVVAYQMWEKAGHPESRDLQFWLDAEAQLRATAKTVKAASVQPGLRQANSSRLYQNVPKF
jgi:hypothetical protein